MLKVENGIMAVDCKKLNERRKELGLTVEELAKIAGLPKGTVEHIFFGQRKTPRFDTLRAIEKALGIKGEDFESCITVNELRLLQAFKRLAPPMQEYALEMIEKLADNTKNIGVKNGNE